MDDDQGGRLRVRRMKFEAVQPSQLGDERAINVRNGREGGNTPRMLSMLSIES